MAWQGTASGLVNSSNLPQETHRHAAPKAQIICKTEKGRRCRVHFWEKIERGSKRGGIKETRETETTKRDAEQGRRTAKRLVE